MMAEFASTLFSRKAADGSYGLIVIGRLLLDDHQIAAQQRTGRSSIASRPAQTRPASSHEYPTTSGRHLPPAALSCLRLPGQHDSPRPRKRSSGAVR
jgi:hypothetical protein